MTEPDRVLVPAAPAAPPAMPADTVAANYRAAADAPAMLWASSMGDAAG